jgi:hypothetical protein
MLPSGNAICAAMSSLSGVCGPIVSGDGMERGARRFPMIGIGSALGLGGTDGLALIIYICERERIMNAAQAFG